MQLFCHNHVLTTILPFTGSYLAPFVRYFSEALQERLYHRHHPSTNLSLSPSTTGSRKEDGVTRRRWSHDQKKTGSGRGSGCRWSSTPRWRNRKCNRTISGGGDDDVNMSVSVYAATGSRGDGVKIHWVRSSVFREGLLSVKKYVPVNLHFHRSGKSVTQIHSLLFSTSLKIYFKIAIDIGGA